MSDSIHSPITDDQVNEAFQQIEIFLACHAVGICPHCKAPIEQEIQRDQYVYAEPCGCLLGPGVARSAEELKRVREEMERARGK